MSIGKIVMLPLDERPCNFDYPGMMPKTDYELLLPPKSIMGDKKKAGDTAAISKWLKDNAKDASAMIIALDTLIYGGIVPSRLHYDNAEELINRANVLKELKEINPNVKIYAFELIMRCPTYSSDAEEPDYYEQCGAEIFLYGKYTHMQKLGRLSADDEKDFKRVKKAVEQKYIDDFVTRRKVNLEVLMHNLKYILDGTVDYFIVPQDDSNPYGYTAMDQMVVREFLKSNTLHLKTAMYPSADDTGMILLARAVAELSDIKPKVYVKYASSKGDATIPNFEDRVVDETVKYHIMAMGGVRVYSLPEADILLAVNIGSFMTDDKEAPNFVTAYDIERNLAEFVTYIEYAKDMGKSVAVADIAWANTGDVELVKLLYSEDLLLKIDAYAGWNTSSNTTGTALCQALLYLVGKDNKGNKSFLLHRYYEDIGYMAYARQYVTDNVLPPMNLNYYSVDGKCGKAAEAVKNVINDYMTSNFPKLAELVDEITVNQPWERMFETDVKLKIK